MRNEQIISGLVAASPLLAFAVLIILFACGVHKKVYHAIKKTRPKNVDIIVGQARSRTYK